MTQTATITKPKKNVYVKNSELVEALITYHECKAAGDTSSRAFKTAYEKIGLAVFLISENLSKKPIFSGYSYRSEMVGDAIENCFKYLDNFKVDIKGARSGKVNPFAYFTQVCYYAFLRRIKKEKKQTIMKARLIISSGIIDQIDTRQEGDEGAYANAYLETLKSFIDDKADVIESADEKEIKIEKKKVAKKTKKRGLELI